VKKPQLIIGNKNYSSWSFRAWIALAKLGIEFDEVRIPLCVEGFKKELYKYSPAGKVPIYIEDTLAIWDTLAILEYLAERHPLLWPREIVLRARARSISAEMHSGFLALRDAMPMNCRAINREVEITKAVEDDITRIQAIWSDCRTVSMKKGPWLFGHFTIADAMFAPVVSRFLTYGVLCTTVVKEYMDKVLSDPHVAEWYEASRNEIEVIEACEVGVSI